jgi:predicted RNA methylase
MSGTATETRKWQNVSAGPRQVKDLNKAMGALRGEGRAHDEIMGVVGGEEHRSTYIGMCEPERPEVTALAGAIQEKYGYEITSGNVRAIIADYAAAIPEARKSRPVVDSRRTAEEDGELKAKIAAQNAGYEAKRAAADALLGQVTAKAPAGSKALIYAEWHEDTSDPQSDHYGSRVTRTVAIGFRAGSREDFRALRKAAGDFPETAHLATDEDAEHRENYSMGGGNFLSDHGSSDSGTGWVVRSREFPCQYVELTEDAAPAAPAAPAPAERTERKPGQPRATVISGDVLDILSRAVAEGNAVRMTGRLDRATYVAVNEVLTAAGGKWNRKAQAHLFSEDAAPVLASLLGDGSIVRPQDEGWFPTPPAVLLAMTELAPLGPGMEVLEPSAGEGAIASAAAGAGCVVDCIEQNAKRAGVIYAAGYARTVTMADFLAVPQRPAYDRVFMNPPFADKADIAHVRHALGFLRPGGVLVAVMSNGVMSREDRATASFREMAIEAGGEFEPLPEGAFKESGTGVRAVLAVIPAVA